MGIVQVVEKLVLPFAGRGEGPENVRRHGIQHAQQIADNVAPKAVRLIYE